MPQDTFIELRSRIGNRITCPSEWSAEDEGAWWTITDGQAVLAIYTCTVEGSGSPAEFREMMASSLAKDPAQWRPIGWRTVDIGGVNADKGEIDPVDEESDAAQAWRLYVLQIGRHYHALCLRASPMILTLNGGFYESVVRTFKGIDSDA
jgi:hypothetical protein